VELYAQVVDEGRWRTLPKQIGDNSPRIRAEPLCHLFCRENFLRFHLQDKHNASFVIISNSKEKRNLPFHAAKIGINERETSNLFEYFSQRVQNIFEVYLKDSNKRVKIQVYLNIYTASASVFEVNLNDRRNKYNKHFYFLTVVICKPVRRMFFIRHN